MQRARVFDLPLFQAGDPQRRGDVLINTEIRIIDELLIDHRDVPLLHWNARHILAVVQNRSGGRSLDAGHQPHQGRLAGERASKKDVESAFLDDEVSFVM